MRAIFATLLVHALYRACTSNESRKHPLLPTTVDMAPMNKYNNINAKFRIMDSFTASDRSFYGKVQASSGKGI